MVIMLSHQTMPEFVSGVKTLILQITGRFLYEVKLLKPKGGF